MANTDSKTTRNAKNAAATAAKATADTAEQVAEATQSTARDAADLAFSYARFEGPEFFRSFAEQGLSQTREAYARMRAAAEEATDLLEDSMENTRESLREVQFKALDIAKANTDAAFEFYRQLLSARSVADAIQLQTTFARERFESFLDYSKDVQATLTKASVEATKPAKAVFERTLNMAKPA